MGCYPHFTFYEKKENIVRLVALILDIKSNYFYIFEISIKLKLIWCICSHKMPFFILPITNDPCLPLVDFVIKNWLMSPFSWLKPLYMVNKITLKTVRLKQGRRVNDFWAVIKVILSPCSILIYNKRKKKKIKLKRSFFKRVAGKRKEGNFII